MDAPDAVDTLLPGYAAAELDDVARERVERALVRSASLRAELRRYRRLFGLLTALRRENVVPTALLARRLRRLFRRA